MVGNLTLRTYVEICWKIENFPDILSIKQKIIFRKIKSELSKFPSEQEKLLMIQDVC